MKKWLILLLALFIVLAGCGKKDEPKKDEVIKNEEQENEKVAVDKGFVDVTITLPSSLFEDEWMDAEGFAGALQEKGVKKVEENDDGSITFVITKSKHKELMKEMREETEAGLKDIETDEDFPSIQTVTYNKNFSKITMGVDKEVFENSFDAFVVFGLGMSGMIYQIFEGIAYDKVEVQIDILDIATKEVIESVTYPEGFENLQ